MDNKIHNLNPYAGAVNTTASIPNVTSGYITTSNNSIYGGGGSAGISGGLVGPYYGTVPQTTPYYSGPISTQLTPYYGQQNIVLRKVENGWILNMHNKEYVLTETEQVTKYLKLFEENQIVK